MGGSDVSPELATLCPGPAANMCRTCREGGEAVVSEVMHGLTVERRRARTHRRQQIRRRRLSALVALFILVSLAVWAAYAVPSTTPAQVPNAALAFAAGQGQSDRLVVAQVQGIDLLLPVKQDVATAVAYHPVDNPAAVELSPSGDRVSGGGLVSRLADVFKGGGDIRYYLMSGEAGDSSSQTAGLDVGAVPGSFVFSPVDGRVTGVKTYKLLGRYTDQQVDIQVTANPGLLLVATHVTNASVKIGDTVHAGQTVLGRLRAFPAGLSQSLKQYTSDAGDHVQLMVLRVPTTLAGF